MQWGFGRLGAIECAPNVYLINTNLWLSIGLICRERDQTNCMSSAHKLAHVFGASLLVGEHVDNRRQ